MKIRFLLKERHTESTVEFLKRVYKQNQDKQLFVHFSNLKGRLGINPKSNYKTPIGVYGYPLDNEFIADFLNKSIPFAADRKYCYVFYHDGDGRVQIMDDSYTQKDLELDCNKIIPYFVDKLGTYYNKEKLQKSIDWAGEDAKYDTRIAEFWNITRTLTPNQVKWTDLLVWLGYDGFIDYGNGLIHNNERTQAVLFKNYKLLASSNNDYMGWNSLNGYQHQGFNKYKLLKHNHECTIYSYRGALENFLIRTKSGLSFTIFTHFNFFEVRNSQNDTIWRSDKPSLVGQRMVVEPNIEGYISYIARILADFDIIRKKYYREVKLLDTVILPIVRKYLSNVSLFDGTKIKDCPTKVQKVDIDKIYNIEKERFFSNNMKF